MELLKKHVDTVIVLGGILSAVLWMNHKFTEVDGRFTQVDARFAELEKDIAVIKAVMVTQGHMAKELVTASKSP